MPLKQEDIDQTWDGIKRRIAEMIGADRPMWRDDGVDIGRADIIDVTGVVTKAGNIVTVAGASATLPNEMYISFGIDPLNVQVFLP